MEHTVATWARSLKITLAAELPPEVLDIPVSINRRFTRVLGRCSWSRYDGNVTCWIEINKILLKHREQHRETFLHEVAHAWCDVLGALKERHGLMWKSKARRLGCTKLARVTRVNFMHEKPDKLVATCEKCGVGIYRQRRFKRDGCKRTHKGCGGAVVTV